jgi:multidrug resistance efflux pump
VAEARDRIEKARLQVKQWQYDLRGAEAAVAEARDTVTKARLAYDAQIDGINPAVAEIEAKLAQALYYLDQTTIYAPEDGYIVNLQVRPGMVAGSFRIGAIAAFIVEADRYILATYYQEHLKFVKPGQPVEVALNLYPGRILKGKVDSIWLASGEGQLLPSGELPTFTLPRQGAPVGYAVKIVLDDVPEGIRVPIGAQGAAAIYTKGGGFAALRRIVIRTYTWLNWLYPMPF